MLDSKAGNHDVSRRDTDGGNTAAYHSFAPLPPPSDDSIVFSVPPPTDRMKDTPQQARASERKAGETSSATNDGGRRVLGGRARASIQAHETEDGQLQSNEPLAIPKDAEGADWDFLRWLQRRFMGEDSLELNSHDNRASADMHLDDADDQETSWISRMEVAQANIKEPPRESAHSKDLLDEEDEENHFPDAATERLWWSCAHGDIEATRDALKAGAQVNFTHPKYHERTPLHCASCVIGVDASAVLMLIEAGAHVNAQDSLDCRPLHFAAESWDPDKVRALVEAGAERQHENAHGYTALQIARRLYDVCQDPSLEPNPDYDPKWEGEMMQLLEFEGASPYPTLWPLHSQEIQNSAGAGSKGQSGMRDADAGRRLESPEARTP